jgi:hypothetical protein
VISRYQCFKVVDLVWPLSTALAGGRVFSRPARQDADGVNGGLACIEPVPLVDGHVI